MKELTIGELGSLLTSKSYSAINGTIVCRLCNRILMHNTEYINWPKNIWRHMEYVHNIRWDIGEDVDGMRKNLRYFVDT